MKSKKLVYVQEEKVNYQPFLIWLTVLVIVLWGTSLSITYFAPHLEHAQRWPLSITAFIMVWLFPKIRLKAPTDVLSRMRAIFTPQSKKYTLIVLGIAHILAIYWFILAIDQRKNTQLLAPNQLQGFELLKNRSQAYLITGKASLQQAYRWDNEQGKEDLYLIPIQEFSGLLLVLSDHKMTSFDQQWGILLKIRPWESKLFLDYRAEQHIPLDTPLYLFDIRPYRYFVLPQISLLLLSLILFLLVWGAAVRDGDIESTLVYIPKELRAALSTIDADNEINTEANGNHINSQNEHLPTHQR